MAYVGERIEARASRQFELDFRCAHCGFRGRVQLIAIGHGTGKSPYSARASSGSA